MKRIWGHTFVAMAAVAGGSALLPSCAVHDDSSLFVVGVANPPEMTNGVCAYPPASPTEALLIGGGVFDMSLAAVYSPVMLLGNQLVPRGDSVKPRSETNRIQIEGAVVRTARADGTILSSFTALTSGEIDQASGTTPSYGHIAATLVDLPTVNALKAKLDADSQTRVISYAKVFGHTLGGTYVESAEFQWPVVICTGGLIGAPGNGGSCTDPVAASDSQVQRACVAGQDQVVDCRLLK